MNLNEYQCTSCNKIFKANPNFKNVVCPNCQLDATGGGAISTRFLPDSNRDLKMKSREQVYSELGISENSKIVDEIVNFIDNKKKKFL